jgi:hypothetical protein
MRSIKLDQNLGDISLDLPAGVYSVRFHQGLNYVEKLAALTPENPVVDVALSPSEQPEFATAAPVLNTTTTHEWQRFPARDLSRTPPLPVPTGHSGGSHAFFFLRNPFSGGTLPTGITLHDLDGEKLLLDLDAQGTRNNNEQWVGAHIELNPGAYRLRIPSRSSFLEQVVFTAAGWQTQIFLMTPEDPERQQDIGRISILMARPDVGFDFDRPDSRLTEAALRALLSRQNIPGADRSEMLGGKFEDPMLGIYAGLLSLRRKKVEPVVIRVVFDNLHALVGPLPDVLAIGWALALRDAQATIDPAFMSILRDPVACAAPPMLRESWEHLLRASAIERTLIPRGSVADRIGGRLVAGTPWVKWLGVLPAPEAGPSSTLGKSLKPLAGFFSTARKFWGGVKMSALRGELSQLADLLRHPKAGFWLESKRFTDLERRIAYWVEPSLDPRFAAVMKADPEFAKKLRHVGTDYITDEATLLTDLNISWDSAFRTSEQTVGKLIQLQGWRAVISNFARR